LTDQISLSENLLRDAFDFFDEVRFSDYNIKQRKTKGK
jgi:hypothetical protein